MLIFSGTSFENSFLCNPDLDFDKLAELCETEIHTEYQKVSSCAFTNPFYFQNSDFTEPKKITPPLNGKLIDKTTNSPIEGVEVKLIDLFSPFESVLSGEYKKSSLQGYIDFNDITAYVYRSIPTMCRWY